MNNSHLETKLELRRHFLRAYHPAREDRRVFDAFQAGAVIWTRLQQEFELASYWGVDVLEKKGRIKIESSRVLAQAGWQATIVDLDAYGSPWAHWLNTLRNAPGSITVFLTLGSRKGIQRRPMTKIEKQILGIPFKLPPAIGSALNEHTLDFMLAQACHRFDVVEAMEALPYTTARYFGIRLALKTTPNA